MLDVSDLLFLSCENGDFLQGPKSLCVVVQKNPEQQQKNLPQEAILAKYQFCLSLLKMKNWMTASSA